MAQSLILDSSGKPFERANGHRADLVEYSLRGRGDRQLRASYDAAGNSAEFANYWAGADRYDADSAHRPEVRGNLVSRSRYEVGNNGFADGIVQTIADDLVGTGPKLRMQTRLTAFNAAVEFVWEGWAKAILLRRKLWCLAHAKVQDGEGIGLVLGNPGVRHTVKLDLKLIETEQCASPQFLFERAGRIDGMQFDRYDNPISYDILPEHPGAQSMYLIDQPISVPADFVCHWYKLRRPGQHRAVPEFTSTLQVGAGSRRFREATVAAAETAADVAGIVQTTLPPDELDPVSPFSTIEWRKRMLMSLPQGWGWDQAEAKHPNATYEGFLRSQINEMARPKSMPYNKAACDSASYNYASGRLDHQTYYATLDVDREDANDLVLDKLFAQFWREAVMAYGWNPGNGEPPLHTWDWPKHPVADLQTEAAANETKLRSGQTTLSRIYSESGLDFEDELEVMASDYGVTADEMREILRTAIFNFNNQQASMQQAGGADATAHEEEMANA